MPEQILIVEDEERIARILELELTHEGYGVKRISSGEEAIMLNDWSHWSCILLDLQLPGASGLDVLQKIRENDADVPVLIMTARDAVSDKVQGLDLGANDYVTKPFVYEELSARIRAFIRSRRFRHPEHESEPGQDREGSLSADDMTLDTRTRQVVREGKELELTPREYDLLLFLLRHKGEVLTRERILSEVWGFDFMGQTNLVDVYIRYLRLKLDRGFRKKLIRTVRGVGYTLEDPEL